jgi:hypothetical protein
LAGDRDSLANISAQSEDYRKGLVLGFTMAEIMLVLLFLLLLLLGNELKDLHEKLNSSISLDAPEVVAAQDMAAQWKEAKEKGLAPPDMSLEEYVGKLIFRSEADQLDILSAQIKALKEQILSKEVQIQKLNEQIKEMGANPGYIEDLETNLSRVEERLRELAELETVLSEVKADLAGANERIDAVKPIADALAEANLSSKQGQQCLLACGATGRPACWGESIENPDFIYDIAMYDNYLWVALREDSLAKNLVKWDELPDKARIETPMFLSAGDFRRRMTGLVEYGDANDNCVFSVRLFDVGTSTKQIYKDLRQLVGNYAYETPVRDNSRWTEGAFPEKLIIE